MKSIRTKKGTELPLANIKGKPYLQVAHRLVWFREEHPEYSVTTDIIHHDDDYSIVRAEVKSPDGFILQSGTKKEDKRGFPDHLEKAETGAVGRALGMLGFGTQFAPELDEGDRLADSPTTPVKQDSATQKAELAMTKFQNGKFKDKAFSEIPIKEFKSYYQYMTEKGFTGAMISRMGQWIELNEKL